LYRTTFNLLILNFETRKGKGMGGRRVEEKRGRGLRLVEEQGVEENTGR
jgi:hypothetical protein